MYQTITRAGWNARPPTYRNVLSWSEVDKFIVHFSGASRTQSVRSIQDYCMDTKGHSDIDYNDLVRDGVLYEGRGPYKGGHTLGMNSSSYGVCIIGNEGDATDADFNTVRELYDKACVAARRELRKLGHRDALPGHTDCPGDEIDNWVHAGMPYVNGSTTPPEDNVFCKFGDKNDNVRLLQLRLIRAGVSVGASGSDSDYGLNTAAGLASVIGSDGRTYGPLEVDIVDELLRENTVDRLRPRTVPGELGVVHLTVPAQTVTGTVVARE